MQVVEYIPERSTVPKHRRAVRQNFKKMDPPDTRYTASGLYIMSMCSIAWNDVKYTLDEVNSAPVIALRDLRRSNMGMPKAKY